VTPFRVRLARVMGFLRSDRRTREFEEEINDHLERAAADYRARGLHDADARAAAHADFGSLLHAKDAYRDVSTALLLDSLARDLRHSLRSWRRNPMFTTVLVVTLGLSIGATSAVFSLVYAVVLRPLPYPAADRLVQISGIQNSTGRRTSISPPDFFDLRERATTLSAVAAYWTPTLRVSLAGDVPDRVAGTVCTANLLRLLGVEPALGRTFVDGDDRSEADRVAVISARLWRRMLGGDQSILGRRILIDDAPVTIVGIMPADFEFPAGSEVWMPLRLSATQPPNRAIPAERYRQYRILSIVGRMGPEATTPGVRAQLTSVFTDLERAYPDTNRQTTATAESLHAAIVGDVRPAMLLLFAAAACLLLIASVNVATLLTVRAASRQRDMTIRLALGAARRQLVQQALVDSVLTGLAGSALGLAMAYALLGVLLRLAPPDIPRIATTHIDGVVVLFTTMLGVLAGLLFGVAPALQIDRDQLAEAIKSGQRSTSTSGARRLRSALVVGEISLSMLLLVTAGLLTRTLSRLGRVELGFRTSNVQTFDRLDVGRQMAPRATASFFASVLEHLRNTRGIEAAGVTIGVPLDPKGRFFIDESPVWLDRERPTPRDRETARMQVVSDGYFESIGAPILAGRPFDRRDSPDSPPVALISHAFAVRYFPRGDAVGHTLTHELAIIPGQPTTRTIIGVVGDVRQFRLDEPFVPQFFVPHAQMPWPAMALVVQSALPTEQSTAAVRSAVRASSSTVAVPVGMAIERQLNTNLAPPRLRAWIIALFAAVSLCLGAIGLYGTMAFGVQQRQVELAMRLVLGATTRQAILLILRNGLTLAAVGALLGGAAVWPIARLLSVFLFGVSPFDPATVGGVAVVLSGISAIASYVPARRILQLDPVRIIKSE
jgi:putative ABC transport system permease protein